MELFGETNIDFLGRRKIFIGLSLVLILAGVASLIVKGGPKLGIDFKGGTLVYIKFKNAPDLDAIRNALTSKGLEVATLQPFEDGDDSHELKVDLNLEVDEVATSGKDRLIETLRGLYPGDPSKLDFNNAGIESLTDRLRRNTAVANSPLSSEEVRKAAENLIEARDTPPTSGLVKDFSQVSSVEGVTPDIMSGLQAETYLGDFAIRGVEVVGPKVGQDLQWEAFKATMFALGGMLIYIAFRFEWVYGVAAVLAVFHDVLVTVGFFSLFDREIELTVIAALLTLVGYSMNDTIVIFDRVRENRKLTRRMGLEELLNRSVNQTLSRTVLTSGLTFIAVLCLFIFGGEVLRGFSFALVVGILVGTYSSIFIASPLLLWWQDRREARQPAVAAARKR
ncbi:MAG: protein translocase subunit SecF [Bryobacterales bacterium]|nr:protein translocase subunit SecF [Bryobacterales bacterium]